MFVPTIDEVPEHFTVEHRGDGACVSVGLAESDDGLRGVSVDVWLCPFESEDGQTVYEFSYEIVVASYDRSEETFATQDRNMARGYIPDEIRHFIVPCVQSALVELVESVAPEFIYRVTKGRQLPDKALYKHHLITDTLQQLLGYVVVDEGTDSLGRTFWLFSHA